MSLARVPSRPGSAFAESIIQKSHPSDRVREVQVSKITRYHQPPFAKFNHKTMGVIHPEPIHVGSTIRRQEAVSNLAPDETININGSQQKSLGKKALPSHLETPYVYVTGTKLNQVVKDVEYGSPQKRNNKQNNGPPKVLDSSPSFGNGYPGKPGTSPTGNRQANSANNQRERSIRDIRKTEDEKKRSTGDWNVSANQESKRIPFGNRKFLRGKKIGGKNSDKAKLYEQNMKTLDQTFKVYECMLKKRYGNKAIEVDYEDAEQGCLSDYNIMLRMKHKLASDELEQHIQQRENELADKRVKQQMEEVLDRTRREEEEQERRMNEIRGVGQGIIPVLMKTDEEIDNERKAREEEESRRLGAQAMVEMVERRKQQDYEKRLSELRVRESEVRSQLDDFQCRANYENFRDFLLGQGVPLDQFDLIDQLFRAYVENEENKVRSRYATMPNLRELGLTIGKNVRAMGLMALGPHVNLRTFLFNYKRWLKDRFKKKDMTSPKKAKDLNSLLRTYLLEWKNSFPKFMLPKMSKISEIDKKEALRDLVSGEVYLQVSRRDLETFNYLRLLDEHKTNELTLKEFNNSPLNTMRLQEKYNFICGRLPEDLFRKKLVIGLLNACMPPKDNIQFDSLLQYFENKAGGKSNLLERMGELLDQYKRHKVQFKEEDFNLFDLANWIHTELTDMKSNELMFMLVGKLKQKLNEQFGHSESAEIDPRKNFDIKELDDVFAALCDKNQKEIRVLSGFIEELELFVELNHYDSDNPQVHESVRDNIVATFVTNYLEELDREIEDPCIKVMQIYGRSKNYRLDVCTSMPLDCFKDMCRILRLELSPEEAQMFDSMRMMNDVNATNFFQSKAREMSPGHNVMQQQGDQDPAALLAGLPSPMRKSKAVSFAVMHPELGLTPHQYEDMTHESMLKGSVGVYLKDPIHHNFNLEQKMIPKIDGLGAEYPTIFPVEYYKNILDKERVKHDKDAWYLRPHHIETLTEHPSSLKDNLLDSNYYSFYSELEKDMKGRYLTEAETEAKRVPDKKDSLIGSLEQQLTILKEQLGHLNPTSSKSRGTVSLVEMQKYYVNNDHQSQDPMQVAYESVMDSLRQQEKNILNKKRETEASKYGVPDQSWYTSKTPKFTAEMKKHDRLMKADPTREEKMRRLMNKELY